MVKSRNSFKGSLGFVMAAAGSAVGLGNIWRFPYLAAKDGGGLFLAVYIIMALTFGFALLTTEIAIGRKTKQSPLTAYDKLKSGWKFLGIFACIVPVLILPYYVAIGGWVLKYFMVYLTGDGVNAAADGYFGEFISGTGEPVIYMLIFLILVAAVILLGVNKGIEASSKILMPILLVLVVAISVFALTISYTDESGTTRTGIEGFKIYIIPSFEGMTFGSVFSVIMDAVGQLFFSLSVAMGIMITYGSYVSDDANLSKSINQIEIFDTAVAFLAGVMIIPAVYTFEGREGMTSSGPSLMFISLPKVFNEMGSVGNIIGCVFFAMVFFAALSSGISIMEAIVSSFMDEFRIPRLKAAVIELSIAIIGGILVCLGYNKLYFEIGLPNGAKAQILDILDYISNNIFMPIVAIGTCILVGWIIKPESIVSEIEKHDVKMGRKKLYSVMIKYIAPVLLIIILLKSVGLIKF